MAVPLSSPAQTDMSASPRRFSRKKIGWLVLLLVLILLAVVLFPRARHVWNVDRYANVTGDFSYSGDSEQISTNFVYKDSYFAEPSTEYSPSLATMSCALALSTFSVAPSGTGDGEATDSASNARDLLEQLGFKDIEVNEDYKSAPTRESIGVIVGHKELSKDAGGGELLAVAVRGGGYGSEWASNMNVGTGKEHAGFAKAADVVLDFVNEYQGKLGINEGKIWVTGYSRGGAVAGLTAYKLLELGEVAPANLYAYTFEAPASLRQDTESAQAEKTGIWNIVNPADIVPRLPLSQWGYTRPGHDILIPDVSEKSYEDAEKLMRDQLGTYDPKCAYAVTSFTLKKIDLLSGKVTDAPEQESQSDFLDVFSAHIAGQGQSFGSQTYALDTAQKYSKNVEAAFIYFADLFAQAGAEKVTAVHTYVWDDIRNHPFAYAGEGVAGLVSDRKYERLVDAYAHGLEAEGISYDRSELEKAVNQSADFILGFALFDSALVATALDNADSLGQPHDASVTLAWLRAADNEFVQSPITLEIAPQAAQ
ncbi:MAG: lipase family protein [Actinomycetaceae bacterium]|nr:lipase family protein [Actinomycetaceae bacterium]